MSDDVGDVDGAGAPIAEVVVEGDEVALALALADAEGDTRAEGEGDAETEGDGVGLGETVFVGVGVGDGLGADVIVKVAEAECRTVLSTKLALTVCDPEAVWPLNGLSPDLVTVHVLEVFGNDVVARKDPSHRSVTVPGHFPLVVYTMRALNDCVAGPLFGESVKERAANAASATNANANVAISARRSRRYLVVPPIWPHAK